MPRIKVPGFIGGAYTLRSMNVDCQRAVNVYPEVDESGEGQSEERMSLRHRYGLRLFAQFAGATRGMWTTSKGRAFAVSAGNLCEILPDGSGLSYSSSIETTRGTVSITDNGNQLLMVDGDKGFILDLSTNAVTEITAGAFPVQPEFAAFLDGYFLVNNAQSQQVSFSGLYDGLTWDGLDIFSKQAAPDNLRAMLPASGSLYCIGDYSYEVFYDTGDALSPFQRITGAFGEVGIAAPQTLKVVDRTPFFVGKEKQGANMVYKFDGYRPVRISTHAIERMIQDYGDISTGTAWGYQLEGHTFYCINLPNATSTLVYDAATNLWHEETWTDTNGLQHRHRAEHHCFAFNKHLVGDWQNGNIYELRDDVYTDNSGTITKLRTFPHFSDQQRTIFLRRLEVYMETGVGCPGVEDTGAGIDIATVSGVTGFSANLQVRDVTVVTTSAHGLVVGNNVLIDGVDDSSFDGNYPVTQVIDSTSFVYVQINDGSLDNATSANGTATKVNN